MSHFGISASALLYTLVGDDADFNQEYHLHDWDDQSWTVEEDEEDEEPQPPRQQWGSRRQPLMVAGKDGKARPFVSGGEIAGKFLFSICNSFECAICLEPFHELGEDETYTLPCGHKYCKGCVGSYVGYYAGENLPMRHKGSDVTRDGVALVVTRAEWFGVPCPNKSCRKIFPDSKYSDILTEDALQRYTTLKEAQIRRERDIEFNLAQIRADNLLASWSLNKSDIVRLCPHCYTQIEKNGGCENMDCSRCMKHFIWPNAIKVGSKKHWLGDVIHPTLPKAKGKGKGKDRDQSNYMR